MKLDDIRLTPEAIDGICQAHGLWESEIFEGYAMNTPAVIANAATDKAIKDEIEFLEGILKLPFFEFCLQVKERKQALKDMVK